MTLQSAYNAIPATITQPYRIEISYNYDSQLESFPVVFTPKAGAGPSTIITIVPNPASSPIGANISGRTDRSPLIVFDGASWITFNGYRPTQFSQGLSFDDYTPYPDTTLPLATYPAISFINGAKHNQLLYCHFTNTSDADTGRDAAAVLFGGTSGMTGNDSNTVADCVFANSYNMLASAGNPQYPNTGLAIRRNTFNQFFESAVMLKNGTAAAAIDANLFIFGIPGTVQANCLAVYHIQDTVSIIGNTFSYLVPAADSEQRALHIAPQDPGNTAGYCLIANNFFTYTSGYGWNGLEAYMLDTVGDDATKMAVIDISGNNAVHAGIFHNTFRMSKFYRGGSSARSVLLRYSGTNSGNDVQVRNNLFINQRTGGAAGSEHLALQLDQPGGITTDYNSYSSGASIRVGSTRYPSYAAYRAANSNRDIHSNDSTVIFETINGDQLSASMYAKPALQGLPITAVAQDRQGRTRNFPYRGSCEVVTSCNGSAFGGTTIALPSISCAGRKIWLTYRAMNTNNGVVHQWQQRSGITTAFTDIPGANSVDLLITQADTTVYRVKDSCVAGGAVVYSNQLVVGVRRSGLIGGLTETHTGLNYRIVIVGATVASHIWNFGDGTGGTYNDTVQNHIYAFPGTYQVNVTSQDGCEQQTATRTINTNGTSIESMHQDDGYRIYPSPADKSIRVSAPAEIDRLTLMDGTGRVIWRSSPANTTTTLDVSACPAGYYLLRIHTGSGVMCRQIAIVH